MEIETVKPALTTRIEFIIHRPAVYYCQLCGTWCNEIFNQTFGLWEYHCYHHGIVAEVHKEPMAVSPDIVGHMDNRGDLMVEAYTRCIRGKKGIRREGL